MNKGHPMKNFYLFILLLLITGSAYADAEAEIKYRQSVMKSVGGHMASMAAILKGKTHFDDLKVHASAMATLSTIVPTVFPEGSDDGHTEALKAIWAESDKFQEAIDRYTGAAKEMDKAAAGGEMQAIGPAISNLGKSCKGCHDNFREEHEN